MISDAVGHIRDVQAALVYGASQVPPLARSTVLFSALSLHVAPPRVLCFTRCPPRAPSTRALPSSHARPLFTHVHVAVCLARGDPQSGGAADWGEQG